jgi:pimeloyl-ACP methyl ester carboxylesterase
LKSKPLSSIANSSHPTFPPFSFEDAVARVDAKVVKYGEQSDQQTEFYGSPRPDGKVIVLIHGGYWRVLFDCEHIRPLAVALAQAGYHIAIPEFRREAGNPDVSLEDLKRALIKIDGAELILLGYSSGGHLGLLIADLFPRVSTLIALAPVTNLAESQRLELGRGAVSEWLGAPAASREDLDPSKVAPVKCRQIFIQGDSDERVPIELTLEYIEYARHHGTLIEMVTLVGTTHFEMMQVPSPTFDAILAAL